MLLVAIVDIGMIWRSSKCQVRKSADITRVFVTGVFEFLVGLQDVLDLIVALLAYALGDVAVGRVVEREIRGLWSLLRLDIHVGFMLGVALALRHLECTVSGSFKDLTLEGCLVGSTIAFEQGLNTQQTVARLSTIVECCRMNV